MYILIIFIDSVITISALDTVQTTTSTITQTTTISTTSGSSNSNAPRTRTELNEMTDEETIRSLVEGGMDPSFLDALPEDMRREVISDHRHFRQVQQQLSSLDIPENLNLEWLGELPPHIQIEVQFNCMNV